MNVPLKFLLLSALLFVIGCTAEDRRYFFHGPADGSPAPRVYKSSFKRDVADLDAQRRSGERQRYQYDMNAFQNGRRSDPPNRAYYGF